MKGENVERKPYRRKREEVTGGNVVDITKYSLQDVDDVLDGWRKIYKNATELGLEAFKSLFNENPKYMTFFSNSLSVEHLDEDEFSVDHARAVMRGINMAMNSLAGIYEEDIEVLPAISHTHHKRGLTPEVMIDLKICLLTTFRKFLNSNYRAQEVWETIMDFIFNNYILKYIPEESEKGIIISEASTTSSGTN